MSTLSRLISRKSPALLLTSLLTSLPAYSATVTFDSHSSWSTFVGAANTQTEGFNVGSETLLSEGTPNDVGLFNVSYENNGHKDSQNLKIANRSHTPTPQSPLEDDYLLLQWVRTTNADYGTISLELEFESPLSAVYFDFDGVEASNSLSNGWMLNIGTESFKLSDFRSRDPSDGTLLAGLGGGIGIVSDSNQFGSVSFTHEGVGEHTIQLDNVAIATQITSVPLPPAVLLLTPALLGLIGFKRARKAA